MAEIEKYFQRIRPIAKGCPEPLMQDALLNSAREFAAETLIVRRSVAFPTSACQFAASVSGNVLTVTAITQVPNPGNPGVIAVGQTIFANMIPAGTTIAQYGTGSGGIGTYVLSTSVPTITSEAMASSQDVYPLAQSYQEEPITVMSMTGTNINNSTWNFWPGNPTSWNPSINPSTPLQYAFIPYSNVALWPTPDGVYQINGVIAVQPAQTALELPDEIVRVYDRQVCDGALAWLLQIPNRPWSNLAAVGPYTVSFQSGVSRARADLVRSFNSGGYRARPRSFIV